jgi:hypothetical protein
MAFFRDATSFSITSMALQNVCLSMCFSLLQQGSCSFLQFFALIVMHIEEVNFLSPKLIRLIEQLASSPTKKNDILLVQSWSI